MAEHSRAGVARQQLGQSSKGENEKANGKGHPDANGIGVGNLVNVKDKRLRGLLAFAHTLENDLNCLDASISRDVFNFTFTTVDGNGTFRELENSIATFPTKLSASARDKAQELDEKATGIWNVGTRLRRSLPGDNDEVNDEETGPPKTWDKRNELRGVLVMVRMFAFLLLDCANECGNAAAHLHLGSGGDKHNDKGEKARGNLLRLMKVGIKTGRDCLNEQKTDYAVKVLEKLAAYSEALVQAYDSSGTPEEKANSARFTAEYFVLRTLLAWRQDDMQLAEHMFNKSMSSKQLFDHSTTESLSDTLYEMGKALLEKKQHTLAAKWLGRAYDVLSGDELDKLSADATELRISIIEKLIKALLETKTIESIQRARDLVDLLENELGDKLIVLLLKMELLTEIPNETFDGPTYSAILNKMTRILVMNPRNLRLFMFHVRKLHDKAPSLACMVMDEMIRLRVKELAAMMEWLEKALLTRIWMTVSGRDTEGLFTAIEGFLSMIADNVQESIGVEATMAAHTLIWKRIEATYGLQQYEVAEKWCRLALHRLFEKPGEANMAKISRKLLLCALGREDINSARDIFGSMSDVAKEEPLTRFLLYKIAIRSGEVELAAECLKKVASYSEDSTLLFACVLDAKKAGKKTDVLDALWMVLDKCGYAKENVHLPALIRTTVLMLLPVIENAEAHSVDTRESIEKLCKLFEEALNTIQRSPNRKIWSVLELEWFSRNSYNLSLKHLSIWEPSQSLRMLACCIGIIDRYPQDIGEDAHDDVTLRKMFCNFCAATTFVSVARAEQNVEQQLQFYLNLRKHVASFDNLLQEKLEKLEEEITDDLLQKLSVLLAFDFEAACRLKDWDGLGEVILKAGVCKSMKVYELMADCILSCEAPTQVLIMTLKKITNRTWEMEEFDTIKLSKYMRCLFQAAMGNDDKIAEELIGQVCMLAADAAETELPYPTQELDWLATKSFNYAIDLYSADQDEACKRWAEKAIRVAGYCADNGNLERLLRERVGGLRFDS
ncbi:Transcription factor [Ciborinia camelliae]|nr:Transcription factor [Ciborinia camelliae]